MYSTYTSSRHSLIFLSTFSVTFAAFYNHLWHLLQWPSWIQSPTNLSLSNPHANTSLNPSIVKPLLDRRILAESLFPKVLSIKPNSNFTQNLFLHFVLSRTIAFANQSSLSCPTSLAYRAPLCWLVVLLRTPPLTRALSLTRYFAISLSFVSVWKSICCTSEGILNWVQTFLDIFSIGEVIVEFCVCFVLEEENHFYINIRQFNNPLFTLGWHKLIYSIDDILVGIQVLCRFRKNVFPRYSFSQHLFLIQKSPLVSLYLENCFNMIRRWLWSLIMLNLQ